MGARFCRRRSGENPEAELIAQRKAGVKQGVPGNSQASSVGQWSEPGLRAEEARDETRAWRGVGGLATGR